MKSENTTLEIAPDDFSSLAEFEARIEEEVKKIQEAQMSELKNNGKVSVNFQIEGTGMTRLMRDSWASDLPYHALQQLGVESLGCSIEIAIQVCVGEKMFVGNSMVGGLYLVDDDGRLNEDFKSCNWTLLDMITRCETRFLNDSNDRASFIRILNGLRNIDDDEEIMVEDYDWMTPNELREKCNYLEQRIKKKIDELELLYPLVGKSLKDLPTNQIGTVKNPMEDQDFVGKKAHTFQKNISRKYSENLNLVRKMMSQEEIQAKEEDEDRKQSEKIKKEILDNIELLTVRTPETYHEVSSGYILPDGRMIGGRGYAMIHDHICFWLKESRNYEDLNLLKDITYHITEKEVEGEGWIKLSAGHGFMLYEHTAREMGKFVMLTEKQKETIIEWCLANEEDRIQFNAQWMPLHEFTNLNPEDIMEYRRFRWKQEEQND